MIIETNEFKCSNCGYHLYKSNKVTERLKGYASEEEMINCGSCGAKYLLNSNDVIMWSQGKDVKSSKVKEDKVPIITYLILGLFVIAGLCFGIDYLSRGDDSKVSNAVSDILPTTNSQSTISGNVISQPVKAATKSEASECKFSDARKKALSKVKALNLHYVGDDELGEQEDLNTCSVVYRFYVKEIGYDLEGKEYINDKIKHLLITYKKIGDDFEFIEGKLFDSINNTKYQRVN